MKIIKMPVAGMNPPNLFDYIKALLGRLVAAVADFAAPPPALTASQAALSTGLTQLATLEGQVTAKRLEVATLAVTVRKDANDLGDWAEGVTQDPVKLAKVFELRSAGEVAHMLKVEGLDAKMGDHAGEVDLNWHGQKNVQFHEIQSSPYPGAPVWKNEPSCKPSKCTLGGYTSGTTLIWRVRAKGANDTGEWSDIALCLVP
jgi:hypothetical protein